MTEIQRQRPLHKLLLAPMVFGSLLLVSACGGSADEEQDAADADAVQTDDAELEGEAAEEDETAEDAAADEDAVEEGSEAGLVSMEEVEQNDSPSSCWAVMDETVYDLTTWIEEHPGGASRIEQLCGTDAGDAFTAQHGGDAAPESQLAEFEIGTLED